MKRVQLGLPLAWAHATSGVPSTRDIYTLTTLDGDCLAVQSHSLEFDAHHGVLHALNDSMFAI